jgi:hypothetical protein
VAQQIRRFGIGQTAKVVALPFFLTAAAFAPKEAGFG